MRGLILIFISFFCVCLNKFHVSPPPDKHTHPKSIDYERAAGSLTGITTQFSFSVMLVVHIELSDISLQT